MTQQPPMTRQEFEAHIIAKAWQNESFKQELLTNPKAVLARELGAEIPQDIEIRVVEENPNTLYLVLPVKPDTATNQEQFSEDKLKELAGGASTKMFTFGLIRFPEPKKL